MAEINWTTEAERRMRDIYDYIAQDKPVAAANIVYGIYEKKPGFYGISRKSGMYIAKISTLIFAFYCTVIIESRI